MRALHFLIFPFAAVTFAASGPYTAFAQGPVAGDSARDRIHQSEQWQAIEAHLPNPATASPKELELQADILRARRFPEDALAFYRYALDRGGHKPALLNKIGLTELEMKNVTLARGYFQQAVKANKRDPDAWNNLGAVEYLDGYPVNAIGDYKKAAKLDKRQAVFHANLSTAYFEQKDYTGARREMAAAMKLDPQIFERNSGESGIAAHVLSSADRARFSFEMAKMYARTGMEDEMLHSLAMASEAGMDVQREMHRDVTLVKFELDPRVVVLVHNAQALHERGQIVSASSAGGAVVQPLPPMTKAVQE